MYNKFTLARKFIHYYLTAANGKGHGIHSPFMYSFVRSVLNDRKSYYAYAEIEEVRKRMLKDSTVVEVQDQLLQSAAQAEEWYAFKFRNNLQ